MDDLALSFNAFVYQLNLYRAHGVPGFTEMGAAPLAAVISTETGDSS